MVLRAKSLKWVMIGITSLALIFFYTPFLTQGLSLGTRGYIYLKWGEWLSYDDVRLKGGHLIFYRPRFHNNDSFVAKEIALKLHGDLSRGHLFHLDVEVNEPIFYLRSFSVNNETKSNSSLFAPLKSFFSSNLPSLRIIKGAIFTGDGIASTSTPTRFDVEILPSGSISAHFFCDTEDLKTKHIVIKTLCEGEKKGVLNGQFIQTPIASVAAFGASLGFHSSSLASALGVIDGEFKIDFREDGSFKFDSELGFNHLSSSPSSLEPVEGKIKISKDFDHEIQLQIFGGASRNFTSPVLSQENNIHLSVERKGPQKKSITLDFQNVSSEFFPWIQLVISPYCSLFNDFSIEHGFLSGILEADISSSKVDQISVKELKGKNIDVAFREPKATCHIDSIEAFCDIPSLENVSSTIEGMVTLDGARIDWKNGSFPLLFTDLRAEACVQKGLIHQGLASFYCAGLKSNLCMEVRHNKQFFTLKMDGHGRDIVKAFPEKIPTAVSEDFFSSRILILANIDQAEDQTRVDGTIHVKQKESDPGMDLFHFGGDLQRQWGRGESDTWGAAGWFHAQNLSLERYLSPLIFREKQALLSGTAEIQGLFDTESLRIKYDAKELKIENEDLCIELDSLHPSSPGTLEGSYEIDFRTQKRGGFQRIDGATYWQKNKELLFCETQGSATFKDDTIEVAIQEIECEGVRFGGSLVLDYSDPLPGVFEVDIHSPVISGKFSKVQHLLSRLDAPDYLNKIPLEGDVIGKGEGLHMHFFFFPGDFNFDCHLKGVITDGNISFEDKEISLREIDMEVEYDHPSKELKLRHIQGALLFGKPRHMKEYLLVSHTFDCTNPFQPEFKADVQIFDKDEELFRLKGHVTNHEGNTQVIEIDQKYSHLSSIYFHHWGCKLKNWSEVEQFDCRASFDLRRILKDLSRFRFSAIPFLSHDVMNQISSGLDIEGKGSIGIKCQLDRSISFHVETGELKCRGEKLARVALLKGSKQDRRWIIDQLQWDDLSVYAEISQHDEKWKIPFLGLKIGQGILLGLDGGGWQGEGDRFSAQVKYSQIDLSYLDQFQLFKSWASKWQPKGLLRTTGNIEIDFKAKSLCDGFKVDLLGEISHFSLRNYPLHVPSPFAISMSSNGKCLLSNAKIELSSQKKGSFIDLQECVYDCNKGDLDAFRATFDISEDQFIPIIEASNHHFSDFFDDSLKKLATEIKQEERLKGEIRFLVTPDHKKELHVDLNLNHLFFKKRSIDVKNIHVTFCDEKVTFLAETAYENTPFSIEGALLWPTEKKGWLSLKGFNENNPLVITGENKEGSGWMVLSARGNFAGCSFNLERRSSLEKIDLQGNIEIDIRRCLNFFSMGNLSEKLKKLKFDSRVRFNGLVSIDTREVEHFFDAIAFEGDLYSDKLCIKGFEFEEISSHIQCKRRQCVIEKWTINDPALKFDCRTARFHLNENGSLTIPHMEIKDLHCALLKRTEGPLVAGSKYRSLIWTKIAFQDVKGDLLEPSTWQGFGSARFENIPKKNVFAPLFTIPSEIILRLGLDPHVLNPVTGTIEFHLLDERIYLTKFKDVYSEGRGSKFYLADSESPSWVDFDGRLSVNIRMKQYNLIFKIAELFTVTMEGDLTKPVYSLQKHSKKN